ncbi:MAG: hypothetical protein GXO02_00785, partial [Epsilonproteobacteria bacterium]|nr:hypothetical protein [Campylobacterota bacterium]
MRLFIFLFITISLYSKISDYKIENFCIKNKNSEYKIIRSFKKDNQKYYLAIDTTSLNSTLLKKIANQTECKNSRLNYLLDIATAPPYPITNDGITHFKKGTFLTIDLCPSSKKGFEKRIFESLEKKFKNNIPLTIFLTKRWAIKHKKEFLYLKNNPSLNILWGNHTA